MTCYHPLLAFKHEGKITFNSPFPFARGFNLPCSQCVGCRLNYARNWAIRIMHEAQMHEDNMFITLTFNPESLNKRAIPSSLDVTEFQRFMKRLRKQIAPKKIRYFHCGEYGEKKGRPHYHAIIFGHKFDDLILHEENKKTKVKLYTSKKLEKLWPYGFSTIGNVEFQSASYVARYIMKKQKGTDSKTKINTETGEVSEQQHEYNTMSRYPGIAYAWYQKYQKDIYPHDYVVINNKKVNPPRYYDTLLKGKNKDEDGNIIPSEEYNAVKKRRQEKAKDPLHGYNEEIDRLWVQEEVKIQALKRLIRNLE